MSNPNSDTPDSVAPEAGQLRGLHDSFLRSAARHPDALALELGTERLSYAELLAHALKLVSALRAGGVPPASRVGVLASRSVGNFAGLLAALLGGHTAVPLNPTFPALRTRQMIEAAGCAAVLADVAGQRAFAELATGLSRPVLLIDAESPPAADGAAAPVKSTGDDLALLFFTSGSTGTPKGVGVLHRNAVRFVEMSLERYGPLGLGPGDRFSQFYDTTFDSSMFDLHVGWAFGACVCCPTAIEWVNPNKFIEARALTVIDMVPSMGHSMARAGGWRAGRFDRLRLVRFGGEALPAETAAALAVAAPQAVVDNVYGPTECTVDASYYRWDSARSPGECLHGIVPIGCAGPRVGLKVVDEQLQEVPLGAEGELLISGPQVTPGYWQDPARTTRAFVRLPGNDLVHYRTGDLVRRVPEGQPIPYLGRMDQQIKIAGVRIELGEVEQALREAAGTEMAVAVGWPRTASGASGIVAFVGFAGAALADGDALRKALKARLPQVMVPREVRVLPALPLNVNGKIDRKALLESLQSEAG